MSTTTLELLLEVAEEYCREGLMVVPIYGHTTRKQGVTAGKTPAVTGWQRKRLDWPQLETALRRVWKEHGSANIGIVSGRASGVVCIDIDARHGGTRWHVENEHRLGHCVMEQSGSGPGSMHLLYRYPEGRDRPIRSTNRFAPGVEVLADGGRQFVTWPSVHPSGGEYTIWNGLRVTQVAFEADEPPAWLLDALDATAADASLAGERTVAAPASVPLDLPENVERCRELLARIEPAVEGQAGDARTFRAACLCKDYGLSMPRALEVLAETYNPRCTPPWSARDLRTKVKNAYSYGKKAAGAETPQADFATAVPPEEEKALTPEEQREQEKKVAAPRAYKLTKALECAFTFAEARQCDYLFSAEDCFHYNAEGQRWEQVDEGWLHRDIMLHMLEIDRKTALKLSPGKLKNIGDCFALLRRNDRLVGGESDFWVSEDRRGEFVRVANGVLDIHEKALLPHDRDWFSLTALPFAYDPDALAPEFDRFLSSIWGDDAELKRALQLWLGYLLLSTTDQQKFAVFIGASRGGKGVLTRVIAELIGVRNCAACTMTQLGGDFGLQPLLGKRAAFFHDAQKAQGPLGDLATERLISIVGQDAQPVNRKNREIVTAHLPVKLMLVCNEIPNFINARGALTNRMLVFPFRKSFAGQEDTALEGRLMLELPGIFNWALAGAAELLSGARLIQAESATETVNEIHRTLDPVRGFFDERLLVVKGDEGRSKRVSFVTLYQAYRDWCQENGHGHKSRRRFTNAIAAYLPAEAENGPMRIGGAVVRGTSHVMLLPPENVDFPPESPPSDDGPGWDNVL